MNLGLLNLNHDDMSWFKQTLAGKFNILWQAKNEAQALNFQQSNPAVLLLVQLHHDKTSLDVERLLADMQCPVVLFSTDGLNHNQFVFKALGSGVKDFIELKDHSEASAAVLIKKLRQQFILNSKPALVSSEQMAATTIVAIGASTGGPASLNTLVKELPKQFNAAIVIIQHLEGRFSSGLVDWLQQSSQLTVTLIKHQQKIETGVIYIAGEDLHLCISKEGQFMYRDEPKNSLFKPSIDVFFESLSKNWQGNAIGVLLTGMGQDGAQGMKLMKEKGWPTIAQDQASSIVYGMPKAAVLLQAATEVLPLNKIAARLVSLCVK